MSAVTSFTVHADALAFALEAEAEGQRAIVDARTKRIDDGHAFEATDTERAMYVKYRTVWEVETFDANEVLCSTCGTYDHTMSCPERYDITDEEVADG